MPDFWNLSLDHDFEIWIKLLSLRFWVGQIFGFRIRFLSLRFWVWSDISIDGLLSLGVGVGLGI